MTHNSLKITPLVTKKKSVHNIKKGIETIILLIYYEVARDNVHRVLFMHIFIEK